MDRMSVDDENEIFLPKAEGEQENWWVVLAAFLSMLGGIFHAIHEFFDTMSMTASSRYLWKTNQRRFFDEASKDIEAIVNATGTEPGWSVGAGTSESEN